jgi:hypothetical protein
LEAGVRDTSFMCAGAYLCYVLKCRAAEVLKQVKSVSV